MLWIFILVTSRVCHEVSIFKYACYFLSLYICTLPLFCFLCLFILCLYASSQNLKACSCYYFLKLGWIEWVYVC